LLFIRSFNEVEPPYRRHSGAELTGPCKKLALIESARLGEQKD